MQFLIKEAEVQDVEGILNIQAITWPLLYENAKLGITQEDVTLSMRPTSTGSKKLWERLVTTKKDELGEGRTFVAIAENKVVGFTYGVQEEIKGEIRALYLLPEFRRSGIGKALLEKILSWLNPQKDIFLDVATYAVSALSLYKKFGFTEFGETSQKLLSGKTIPEHILRRPPTT